MAGKNSTPCHELKKEGTDVILIDMDPARFYEVNCDCVGILKERASDIENKKPHQTRRTNWRKKTTKVNFDSYNRGILAHTIMQLRL